MTPQELESLAYLRRARDLIDREYAKPLDVPTMARRALMSPAHFSRRFRAAYGETPYSYLMTRSSRFTEIVGETPTAYRSQEHDAVKAMPACVAKTHTRPIRNASSRIGEATREAAA
jgi:hypothetical protein